MTWTQVLLDESDFHWDQFMARLEGLTDEEYLWEPVEGCWSILPNGDGTFRWDRPSGEISPPPVTTIAWRLCHVGGMAPDRQAPSTAVEGVAFVDESHAVWRDRLRNLDDGALMEPLGDRAWWPGGDKEPLAKLILHKQREIVHHGSEVALLRDLFRASDKGRRWRSR